MSRKYHYQPNVFLIPYQEYDPAVHNIEYRYLNQLNNNDQNFTYDPNFYYNQQTTQENQDMRRPRPRPPFPGYGGSHGGWVVGWPGGWHPGWHGGWHPGWYGGWHPNHGVWHGGHVGGWHRES